MIVVASCSDKMKDGYHYATFDATLLYNKGTVPLAMNGKLQYKKTSNGLTSTANNTQLYGVYHKASSTTDNIEIAFYARYSNTATGFIEGNYTASIYGIKLNNLRVLCPLFHFINRKGLTNTTFRANHTQQTP